MVDDVLVIAIWEPQDRAPLVVAGELESREATEGLLLVFDVEWKAYVLAITTSFVHTSQVQ